MSKVNKKRTVGFGGGNTFFVVTIIILLVAASFFAFKFIQVNNKYKEVTQTTEQKNNETKQKVSKLFDLPADEEPIIFEVSDKEKLGTAQVTTQYFDKAQNGDVILAFEKANLSIIYRPGENRIIKTDNYNNFLAAANPIKIAIVAPQDKQAAVEQQLKEKVLNADLVAKETPKASPKTSYVADATGTNAKAAQDLADKLGLKVGELPSSEAKPENASLIVVIAPDKKR
jgi:hypothetical protein